MKRADRKASRAGFQVTLPAAPPSPEESTALAAQGVDINRGNSDLQPLSEPGKEEVRDVGQKLADKGGLDDLTSSKTVRGAETAQAIAEASPTPLQVKNDPNSDMESWSQGNLEGQPKALVRDQIRDLVRNNPSVKIPGQGALSSRPGESFDDFRVSRLSAIRGAMQELAQNPDAKIGRTTHTQVVKLLRGWLANGTPDDLSIKPEEMEDKAENPGQVARLFPADNGKWNLDDVNLEDSSPLQGGIYLIRHGMTPWNKETYEKANGQQDALSQIAKYTKSLDWGRARATAKKAAETDLLSDEQITGAIDSALPDDKAASGLPLHHLLAVASAASPERRQSYAPLIQQHPGLAGLPPDAQSRVADHMRMIGLEV